MSVNTGHPRPGSVSHSQPSGPPPNVQGQGSLPDPEAIARQKDVYLKMLDEQLSQGMSVLDQQVKYQRDYLQVQVEQQKRQFMLQLEQQMKAQDMALTAQYNEQLMALQLQAGQQKAALEQQAMQLSMEYEQRKAEEQMYRQQYDIQRQQMEMAMKMAQDYKRMGPLGSPATLAPSPAAPPPHPTNGAYNPPWAAPPVEAGFETRAGSFRAAPSRPAPSYTILPTSAMAPPSMAMPPYRTEGAYPALPPSVPSEAGLPGAYRPEPLNCRPPPEAFMRPAEQVAVRPGSYTPPVVVESAVLRPGSFRPPMMDGRYAQPYGTASELGHAASGH